VDDVERVLAAMPLTLSVDVTVKVEDEVAFISPLSIVSLFVRCARTNNTDGKVGDVDVGACRDLVLSADRQRRHCRRRRREGADRRRRQVEGHVRERARASLLV
jgi:hypothetical protein